MKNKFYTICILLVVFYSSMSCKPLKNFSPPEYSIEPISKNTYSKLNGTYSNSQDTAFGQIIHQPYRAHNENNISLWNRMFIFSSYKSYELNTTVDIAFLSSRKAIVNGYQNNKLFSSKTIRGKFKNGYFYPRPRLVLIPFFPLAYMHSIKRVRFAKFENNLVVDHKVRTWGFALVAGGLDKGRTTSFYKTIK